MSEAFHIFFYCLAAVMLVVGLFQYATGKPIPGLYWMVLGAVNYTTASTWGIL